MKLKKLKRLKPVPKKKVAKKSNKKVEKTIVTTKTVTTTTTTTKKVNPKETHYLLILDESTSMGIVRNETRIGLNEQIKTIKNLNKKYPKHDYFVSIVKFSTTVTPLIENVPANKVKEFSEKDYSPNGWTALHDAIGMGVNTLKNRIQKKLDSGEASALVVILTDGEENQSREFNSDKIKALITDLEKTRMWTFAFVGANQDAVLTARSLGVNVNNTVNYSSSSVGTGLAFASLSSGMMKRAAFTNAGVYAATTDTFMSEVTRGANAIGEDATLLDLSGNITDADIKKAKETLEALKDKKPSNNK